LQSSSPTHPDLEQGPVACLADVPRRLEDRAKPQRRGIVGRGLPEHLLNQPLQSRIATTTIVVIEVQ
jgi:hypothetical protein